MRVEFHPDVLEQLQRLPRDIVGRALTTIVALAAEPRPPGAKRLVGLRDDWRVRFGQYRIVYEIDDEADTITIYVVAKRSDAYRR